MRKTKLLSATALSVMLAFSANAVAAGSFDDASEEEIAKAVVSVLKKNPQIAYDALVKFRADADTKKAESEKELTPLEQKVADVLMDNPPIIVGALQIYQQQEEQKKLLAQAETYQKYAEDINRAELYAGNPDGKFTLVEFFDFSCGYCRQMAPRIENIIKKNPDVKVVFKPVSFLSPNSELAAKAAVAAHSQGKFLEMYSGLMAERVVNEPVIDKLARNLKLDMAKFKKDYASDETKNILQSIKATADKIGMKSVPTLVLNGMPLYAVEEIQLQRAIDVLRDSEK